MTPIPLISLILLIPSPTLASDSHHPVYLSKTWWEGVPKTSITASTLTTCASLSQKAVYKEAFSFDEDAKLCQILDDPVTSHTQPGSYEEGPDVTKLYVPSKRLRSGKGGLIYYICLGSCH